MPCHPLALPLARLTLAASGLLAAAAQAQSLPDLVRQALTADPAVMSAAAQVRAADERVQQARGAFGPTVQLTSNYTDNRYRDLQTQFDLRTFHSKQGTFQINHPLIHPGLEPALEAARFQWRQAQAALSQAQSEAIQHLVEAAFELLKARDALGFTQAQQVAATEQLTVARRAHQVGTAPLTDVRDAEARHDAVAAQVIAASAELSLRQQTLTELAGPGASIDALLGRGLDGQLLPQLDASAILAWLSDAALGNPQVAQAQMALQAAEAEIFKAKMAHAPTADLSYSFSKSGDSGTVTSSFPRRGDTSAISLNVTVPLFAGGATQARVRETLALRDKAQADIDLAKRTVSLAVRQAFTGTLSSVAQAKGLEAAVRSQELALRMARRAYEVGTKANAEVLDAQSKLFDARRDLSKARYEAWNNFIKLKAQAGKLDDTDLVQLDTLLIEQSKPPLIAPRR